MITPATPAISGLGSAAPVSGALATGLGAASASGGVPSMSFGDMLTQVATDAVGSLKKGEAMAISGIQGKASVQSVVEAVMNADQTLQTALAIRDKAVAAYQEISRMAI